MMDYLETCQKAAGHLRGRFPDFEKKITLMKNSETYWKPAGNLSETCRKPAVEVSGGFRRFPENQSLTDHTVGICSFRKDIILSVSQKAKGEENEVIIFRTIRSCRRHITTAKGSRLASKTELCIFLTIFRLWNHTKIQK